MNSNSTKATQPWYNVTWLVILLCLFILPVGLFALWKSNRFHWVVKLVLTIVFSFITLLFIIGRSSGSKLEKTGTNSTTQEESKPAKKWSSIISFSGRGEKKSSSFKLTGVEAKLKYDYESGDIGMFAVYVVEKGKDIMKTGGFPEVMVNSGEIGETNLSHLGAGEYYLQVMAANGAWSVEVLELK